MVVFLGCLFVGIDWGLAFGVGLAVVVQLGHIAFPRLQLLGCIPGTSTLRQAVSLVPTAHPLILYTEPSLGHIKQIMA